MLIQVPCILSFNKLFKAEQIQGEGEPKFSCEGLVKEGSEGYNAIVEAIEVEKAKGFPQGLPSSAKICLRPSDRYEGWYFFRSYAAEDQRPTVVDINLQKIIDPSKAFMGAEAHVSLNIYSYNKGVSKGITAGLNGVLLTGEVGELDRLDGRPSVEQMFSGIAKATTPKTFTAPPPRPSVPVQAAPVMTALANGATYEQFIQQGWTNQAMIEQGYMVAPQINSFN